MTSDSAESAPCDFCGGGPVVCRITTPTVHDVADAELPAMPSVPPDVRVACEACMGLLLEGQDREVLGRSGEPGLHVSFLFLVAMTPEECRFETLNGWEFPAQTDDPPAEEWHGGGVDEARALEMLSEEW